MGNAILVDLSPCTNLARASLHESSTRTRGSAGISNRPCRRARRVAARRLRKERRRRHPGGEEGRCGRRPGARHRGDQADCRGGLCLRLPDDRRLQGDVRVQRRQASGQYKAPFNQIKNEAKTFTPKDTAIVTPNSDTPYSMVADGLARRADGSLRARGREGRYYSVQLVDMYTYNYGYIGSRTTGNGAGCYMVAGPGLEGRDARRALKRCFRSRHEFGLGDLPHPAFQSCRHRQREEDPGRLQGRRRCRRSCSSRRRPPRRPSTFRNSTRTPSRPNFLQYLDFLLQFAPTVPDGSGHTRASSPRIGIGAGQDLRLQDLSLGAQGRHRPRHEGRLREDREAPRQHRQRGQRLAGRRGLRRPRLLQRQLAAARRCGAGRHLRQRRGGGDVPLATCRQQRRRARRQQAQLHADIPGRAVPAGECLLVGDDV